ncbi:HD-GYP domain-containing protein [Paenibacillus hamazuiensis]|uniref:HD-GYP domain-containing protein n=1 Tax=Paenibacillus hamazuiensis TaxID=2936508 RepID=UPI00200BF4BC|nr:HD-GYP domain-containing protein [Paenibacillus hamazuiensis]
MHNFQYFKNVLSAESITESLESLKSYTHLEIGTAHIAVVIASDNPVLQPAVYSVNMSEGSENLLRTVVQGAEWHSSFSDGTDFLLDESGFRPPDNAGELLRRSGFQSLYAFFLNANAERGLLLFGFPAPTALGEEKLSICRRIRQQMEQLMEKIRFRKQFVKQKVYENVFNALRVKDPFTVNHCYNVSFYSALLGKKAGLSESELETLRLGSLLHDIGKLAVPDPVLLKPGRLTEEEFQIIRQHPVWGYELLKDFQQVEPLLPIVRWHHERFDGRGYPDGLQGDEIPLLARIVSLADAFDAMTSNRVYRNSLSVDEVKNQLILNTGKQFDRELTALFLEIIEEQIKIHLPEPKV